MVSANTDWYGSVENLCFRNTIALQIFIRFSRIRGGGATAGKRGRRGCMINGPVTGPKSLPADLRDIMANGKLETETLDRTAVISKARKAFSYYNPKVVRLV